MLHTDLRLDFVRIRFGRLDEVSGEELGTIFAELEAEAVSQLEASGAPRVECAREMDLRYTGQSWDVRIPVDTADKTQIRQRFELEYDRLFGHIQPDGILEMTALRVVGEGILPRVQAAQADRSDKAPAPIERRSVYLDDGRAEIDVFEGAVLRPGQQINGPALIAEHTTTVLIAAGDRLEVDGANNFMIHLGGTDVR
jgi:N-methylhydantoinase A